MVESAGQPRAHGPSPLEDAVRGNLRRPGLMIFMELAHGAILRVLAVGEGSGFKNGESSSRVSGSTTLLLVDGGPVSTHTRATAQTQFAEASGIRFAHRIILK
jgi:hypothetical protein